MNRLDKVQRKYSFMKKENKEQGITLIVLAVTIAVLFILATVTISFVLKEGGIIDSAKDTRNVANKTVTKDVQIIEELKSKLNETTNETSGGDGGGSTPTPTPEPTPTLPVATVGNSTHTATTLSYTWAEINDIAKAISLNYEKAQEEGSTLTQITKDTEEATVTIGETTYTVGVGDTIAVGTHTARILGFNHDLLTSTSAYGDGEIHNYAGISFEFTDFLTTAPMHNEDGNSSGWVAKDLYAKLNTTTTDALYYTNLANSSYIKQVTKTYIDEHITIVQGSFFSEMGHTTTSEDYLWLLACSEIWVLDDFAAYGYAVTNESTMYSSGDSQTQYKYYKKGSQVYTSNSDYIKKPVGGTSAAWWLRSFICYDALSFNYATSDGGCSDEPASTSYGVAPGFCI